MWIFEIWFHCLLAILRFTFSLFSPSKGPWIIRDVLFFTLFSSGVNLHFFIITATCDCRPFKIRSVDVWLYRWPKLLDFGYISSYPMPTGDLMFSMYFPVGQWFSPWTAHWSHLSTLENIAACVPAWRVWFSWPEAHSRCQDF